MFNASRPSRTRNLPPIPRSDATGSEGAPGTGPAPPVDTTSSASVGSRRLGKRAATAATLSALVDKLPLRARRKRTQNNAEAPFAAREASDPPRRSLLDLPPEIVAEVIGQLGRADPQWEDGKEIGLVRDLFALQKTSRGMKSFIETLSKESKKKLAQESPDFYNLARLIHWVGAGSVASVA